MKKVLWLLIPLLWAGCIREKVVETTADSATVTDSDTSSSAVDSNTTGLDSTDSGSGDTMVGTDSTGDTTSGDTQSEADSMDTAISTDDSDSASDLPDTSTDSSASGDTGSDSDTTPACVPGVAVSLDCDEGNNVVSLDNCGEVVKIEEACSQTKECMAGGCVCLEGWTGVDCATPVVYVNAAIPSDLGFSGRSWRTPFADVQSALAVAAGSPEEQVEIWVAKGRYSPGDTRDATFLLRPNVSMYGGFLGKERVREERDAILNETILDGDIDQNDSATFTMHGGNVYHVVTCGEGAILDGFTIRGGNADGEDEGSSEGGGLLMVNCSMTVSNCVFRENQAAQTGGGMMMRSTQGVVSNCRFENNFAKMGGGMAIGNVSGTGEGMRVDHVAFLQNQAETKGGGVYVNIAAPRFDSCSFIENEAEEGGGAYAIASSGPRYSRCLFTGNFAQSGGGMFNAGADTIADNSVFYENEAAISGGAIENTSYASSPSGPQGSSDATVQNCTIVSNSTGGDYPAVHNFNGEVQISNSILYGNNSGATGADSQLGTSSYANVLISDSIVQYGCVSKENLLCGTNVFDADPLFVNQSAGDLQLLAASPAIDEGKTTLVQDELDLDSDGNTTEPIPYDILGNRRKVDGNPAVGSAPDMGAYEFIPATTK